MLLLNMLHLLLTPQVLDYLVPFFTFLFVVTRFKTELRAFSLFFEVCLFMTQMAMTYFKEIPRKERSASKFMAHAADHYLKTHPKGQAIAAKTNIDARLNRVFKKYRLRHDKEVAGLG